MRQGYTIGVRDIAIAIFGKCCLPQGEHGFGEQKYTTYLGI